MTEKEIQFISLLRSLSEEKFELFCEILERIAEEEHRADSSSE